MRIGLVCPYDMGKPGGVQQVVTELGRHLVASGEDVVVVAPGDPGPSLTVAFESVGESVTVRGNQSAVPVSATPAAWARTRKVLKMADVVHVHEPFIPIVGWAAVTGRDIPAVATFHADPAPWARALYRGLAPLGRLALRGVEMTATSPVSASAIPDTWGEPRIVPNAIDVGSYTLEVDRAPKRVAFLGRDDLRKGLSVLLDAWPEVRQAHPDSELEVMGTTRDDRIPGVRFRGFADEAIKRDVLATSQVFVAPNLRGESFGVVVAEAMAAGCAVVASDIGAFRWVVGEAGILVPPGDSSALSNWIVRLLDDTAHARQLGAMARTAVERFDWSTVLEAYRESYARALS